MRKLSALTLRWMCLVAVVPCARTQRQDDSDKNAYYLFNGKTLEVAKDNPAMRNRCDGRFGLSRGRSHPAAHVRFAILAMGTDRRDFGRTRSQAAQGRSGVREAYLKFFGPDTWGRTTFLNSLGPIAVVEEPTETRSTENSQRRNPGAGNAVSTSSAERPARQTENDRWGPRSKITKAKVRVHPSKNI